MSGPEEGYPPAPGGDSDTRRWTPPGNPSPARPPGPLPRGPAGATGHPGHPGQLGPPRGALAGPAHKPGAVPLRPLRLGDLYDAAFRIIRHNPKATVGSAALVAAAAMALPVLVTVLLVSLLGVGSGVGEALGAPSPGPGAAQPGGGEVAGLVATVGSLVAGSFLQWLGAVFVTGMIAHVTMAAALGRRSGLGEAWAATRGRRWRLVGLVLVLALLPVAGVVAYAALWVPVVAFADAGLAVVFGLLTGPPVLALLVLYYVRVQFLAVPPLMLEGVGIGGALRRAVRLTRGQFWRILGIALLTALLTGIAGSLLSLPVTVVQQILFVTVEDGRTLVLVSVVGQALGTVVASAFVTPFTAGVASLVYVDQRIRKEGFDVELLAAAGIPAGAGPPPGPGPAAPPPGTR